jgi:hypothetical protein
MPEIECYLCGKTFTNHTSLNQHMHRKVKCNTEPIDMPPEWIKCTCGKYFVNAKYHRAHLKTATFSHSGED